MWNQPLDDGGKSLKRRKMPSACICLCLALLWSVLTHVDILSTLVGMIKVIVTVSREGGNSCAVMAYTEESGEVMDQEKGLADGIVAGLDVVMRKSLEMGAEYKGGVIFDNPSGELRRRLEAHYGGGK